MSETDSIGSKLETAFEGSMRLILEQNKQTQENLNKLTNSVDSLVRISIESEARHKASDERFERIEVTQKEQGKKQALQSDLILNITKDVEVSSSRWGFVMKIFGAVCTMAALAATGIIFGINK